MSSTPTNEVAKAREEKYLRNRPFLVVTMAARPADKDVATQVKGWQAITGNVTHTENPVLVDRVNSTHLTKANVIIDVLNQKCIKNSFTETSGEDVVKHFMAKYQEHITEALQVWASRAASARAQIEAAAASVDGTYGA